MFRTSKRKGAVAVVLPLVLAGSGLSASGVVKRVSRKTPFPAACGLTRVPVSSSAVEPSIAVNPRDRRNIIIGYQQDRFPTGGGSLSDVLAVSKDGGHRWRRVLIPGISRCTGNPKWERVSDVWLSFGPDGTAYVATLPLTVHPGELKGRSQLDVSVSRDRGLHWAHPVAVTNRSQTPDRQAITADPRRPGKAYLSWEDRAGAIGQDISVWFSKTSNGGRSWSAPRQVYKPPQSRFAPSDPVLSVLPNGTLVDSWISIDETFFVGRHGPSFVVASCSTDGGRHWSQPAVIASMPTAQPTDPDGGVVVRALPIVSPAVDSHGVLHLAWNDIFAPQRSVLVQAASHDGRHWNRPRTILRIRGQAYEPMLAAAGKGGIGLLWYDTRADRRGDRMFTTDVWFARSSGRRWSQQHVAGPFDALTAPSTASFIVEAGRFVGDYQALVGTPNGYLAAFTQARPPSHPGPISVFFARLGEHRTAR